MKKPPFVSVIITSYNYGEFIKESVGSVLDQSYKNIEIIIINDGSTDNTHEICLSLENQYKNIRYISQTNKGVIDTRNKGLIEARGEYLIFLDADDYIDKDYIQKTVRLAEASATDIVYTDYRMFEARDEVSSFPEFSLEELKNHNYIHISSLIRKACIGKIEFDKNMKNLSHEDWDFFLALCMNGSTAIKCNDTYLMYRIHNSSRNNKMRDDASRLRLAEVYIYVTSKYLGEYPTGTSYLAGRLYADWYIQMCHKANGLEAVNNEHQNKITSLMGENEVLKNSLDLMKSSKYYRLYDAFRKLKYRLNREK